MQAIIATYFWRDRIKEQIDPSYSFAADIIENADLSKRRYLYRFGEYITENELGTARPSQVASRRDDSKDGGRLHGRISDRIYQYRKRSVKNQS